MARATDRNRARKDAEARFPIKIDVRIAAAGAAVSALILRRGTPLLIPLMAAAFLAIARSAGALSPPPPDYHTIIDQIVAKARTARADGGYGGKYAITVIGHADTAGPTDYNLALSLKRAEAVRDALVAAGISANATTIDHRGETEPAVPMADGVSERTNRRVAIDMQ